MKEYQTVKIDKEELKKVTCDICGYIEDRDPKNWLLYDRDMISIDHDFCYGSSRDGSNLKVDICEDCLFEIIAEKNINHQLFPTGI